MRQGAPAVEVPKRAVAAGGEIEGREGPLVAPHALEVNKVHHPGTGLHTIGQRLRQRPVD